MLVLPSTVGLCVQVSLRDLVTLTTAVYTVDCLCFFQPERIDPRNTNKGYDVRSDVWSLGITSVSMKIY